LTRECRYDIPSALGIRVPVETSVTDPPRRRFLSSITTGILTVISGILGVLGGGAVLSSTVRRQEEWLTAAALHVDWDATEQVFRCPCHGGVFDRNGAVMDGPPPEPLTKVATRVDGDRVMVQA
jgi:Rieske [2Fe-2S] domain